jgi:hypothetical protein
VYTKEASRRYAASAATEADHHLCYYCTFLGRLSQAEQARVPAMLHSYADASGIRVALDPFTWTEALRLARVPYPAAGGC